MSHGRRLFPEAPNRAPQTAAATAIFGGIPGPRIPARSHPPRQHTAEAMGPSGLSKVGPFGFGAFRFRLIVGRSCQAKFMQRPRSSDLNQTYSFPRSIVGSADEADLRAVREIAL